MSDRHAFRADWHKYNEGLFFVTICCADKRHYFGEIEDGQMLVTDFGYTAHQCIKQIPKHHHFPVEILNHVIMPNHIHMVIYIGKSGSETAVAKVGALRTPEHRPPRKNNHFNSRLAVVIRTFKAAVTREIHDITESDISVWQRNYYEQIIRSQSALDKIMFYVDTNVEVWDSDLFKTDY